MEIINIQSKYVALNIMVGSIVAFIPLSAIAYVFALSANNGVQRLSNIIIVAVIPLLYLLYRGYRKGVSQNIKLDKNKIELNYTSKTYLTQFKEPSNVGLLDAGSMLILNNKEDGFSKKIPKRAFPTLIAGFNEFYGKNA